MTSSREVRGYFSCLEASSGPCRGRFCAKDSLKQQIKQITFSAEHLHCCSPAANRCFTSESRYRSGLGDDWVLEYQGYGDVSLFWSSKQLWTWTFLTSCKKNEVRTHVSKLREIHQPWGGDRMYLYLYRASEWNILIRFQVWNYHKSKRITLLPHAVFPPLPPDLRVQRHLSKKHKMTW